MPNFFLPDSSSLPSPLRGTLLLPLVFFFLLLASPARSDEPFPVFPCIRDNVSFWEDVYSRYTTTQGILHDQDNLRIIYRVVDLVDWNTPGAAAINKKLIKFARLHYKAILTDLAAGKQPATGDEKRIAALFPAGSSNSFREARDNIRLQIGQKDRFMEGFIRSGAYMSHIQRILLAHNLPPELAYLPHVESSFNPDAQSKAGAIGLWQFTSSTGKRYMTINDTVDERFDPFFSSRAAAILLKDNYRLLGSWPLAITAYNYGTAGMMRAMRDQGTYPNIFKNHSTGIFKFASRNFYSEFLAAVNVARRLEKDAPAIPDRPEATLSIPLAGYAPAEEIRHHFRVSQVDFSRLNPALRQPVHTGSKYIPRDFPIRVPATHLTRQLQNTIPAGIFRPAQLRDHEYIVRRGDTAGAIARKYDIALSELVRTNNLDRRATIRPGQRLLIPGHTVLADNTSIIELENQSKFKPN